MSTTSSNLKVKKDTVICREGDLDHNLYRVEKGKLLVCIRKNHMVTPLAYLGPGDFFGELAFLDSRARSADVIAVEDSTINKIPQLYFKKNMPAWLLDSYRFLTGWIRSLDDVINRHGIKKKNVQSIKALSIDEQRHLYDLLAQDQ